MYRYKIILLAVTFITIWSCAGNATTMEYTSAKTAVRSERDLKKGEEYALKALDMEQHANDARVAYFLATEIYKPRRNWEKMNTMLDIAMERNPEQSLERPFRLDDGTAVSTISDAVKIYKEQVWMNVFNQTVELVDAERFNEAIQKINLAKSVLEKTDNYITGYFLYMEIGDLANAKKDLNQALDLDPNNGKVLEISGDFAQNEGFFESALGYYERALSVIDNNTDLIEKIIFLHVELENYDRAITLSDELLENNPDNPDTYFNVGVIYQRLGTELYDEVNEDYKQLIGQDTPNESDIKSTYSKCLTTLEMIQSALGYFIDSSMLEIDENPETEIAMSEMKRLRKNIKDIYLQSIKQIAANNNVVLN